MTPTTYVRQEAPRDGRVRRACRLFGPSIAAMTAAGVAEAIAGFAATLVLARVTSVAEAGRVFFAVAAVGVVFNVLDPRFGNAVIRFAPRLPGAQAAGLFARCLRLDIALGAAGGLLAAALVLGLPASGLVNPSHLLLAVAASSVATGYGTASAAFSITDGLRVLGGIRVAVAVGGVPIVVFGAVAFGASGFLLAQALLSLLSTALVAVVGRRRMRRCYGQPCAMRLRSIPAFLPFTVKASAGTTLLSVLDRLPLTVLGLVGGPVPVAVFRVGLAPARLLATAIGPVSSVLFPWLSERSAAGQVDRLRAPLRRASLGALLPALVLTGCAVPVLDVLVPAWFGPEYDAAVPVASLLLLAAALRSCVPWAKVLLLALGRPGLRLVVVAVDGLALTLVTLLLASSVVAVAAGHVAVAVAVVAGWLLIAERVLARGGQLAQQPVAGDLR